jgi:phosphohistidine phosphatase SixA
MFLTNIECAFIKNATYIHSSPFSKAQKTAELLCDTYAIYHVQILDINPNVQDLDTEECIQLVKQTSQSIETLVLMALGVTVSRLYSLLAGQRKVFSTGSTELAEPPLTNWSLLNTESAYKEPIDMYNRAWCKPVYFRSFFNLLINPCLFRTST